MAENKRAAICALLLSGAACCGPAIAADDAAGGWPEVGRQGLTRFVIVPAEQARDREAYTRQIARLCTDGLSCFVNFYTNSSGAELTMPLPDAVIHEATAVFRRSTKQGAELFRWSCRLGVDAVNCF